jgi:hypothetical protein
MANLPITLPILDTLQKIVSQNMSELIISIYNRI